MMKKFMIFLFAVTFLCLGGVSLAADMGPADMTLQAVRKMLRRKQNLLFSPTRNTRKLQNVVIVTTAQKVGNR